MLQTASQKQRACGGLWAFIEVRWSCLIVCEACFLKCCKMNRTASQEWLGCLVPSVLGCCKVQAKGRRCMYLLSSESLVGVIIQQAHDQLLCLHGQSFPPMTRVTHQLAFRAVQDPDAALAPIVFAEGNATCRCKPDEVQKLTCLCADDCRSAQSFHLQSHSGSRPHQSGHTTYMEGHPSGNIAKGKPCHDHKHSSKSSG